MRIQDSEPFKAILQRCFETFFLTRRRRVEIREDLEASPDPVARELLAVLDTVNGQVRSEYHRNSAQDVLEFLLWTWVKDTAYKAQGHVMLAELLKPERVERLRAALEGKTLDPSLWAANVYAGQLERIKEARK